MALLEVKGARKLVGAKESRRQLWRDVSFSINEGEIVAVAGPSGAGKSTLLNCVGLLDRLDSGSIRLAGTEYHDAPERKRQRARRDLIGYLFQDYALVDNDSARSNVEIAYNSARLSDIWGNRRRRREAVDAAFATVGLSGKQEQKVRELSGGEQQRVAMARLLVRRPKLVLADEPTASLDRKNAGKIINELRSLSSTAATLIVTHDPWVMEQCDRVEYLSASHGE